MLRRLDLFRKGKNSSDTFVDERFSVTNRMSATVWCENESTRVFRTNCMHAFVAVDIYYLAADIYDLVADIYDPVAACGYILSSGLPSIYVMLKF